MKKILRWGLGFFFALFVVLFAIGNRHLVPVTWSPFHDDFLVPSYVYGLGLFLIGFLAGLFTGWVRGFSSFLERRTQKQKIRTLEKELEGARTEISAQGSSLSFLPSQKGPA